MSTTHVYRDFSSLVRQQVKTWQKNNSLVDNRCPVMVCKLDKCTDFTDKMKIVVLKDQEFEEDAMKLNQENYLIGYDIETQNLDSESDAPTTRNDKLVSHQWYFSFPGYRFGVILLSDMRITETQFIEFIRGVVPQYPIGRGEKGLENVYISAHFSLYEGGWLKPDFTCKSRIVGDKVISRMVPVIEKKDKKWTGKARLIDRHGFKSTKTKIARGVWLHFCESMDLQSSSLKKLGAVIGIPKLEHDNITKMEEFLRDNPLDFYRYGIRDSVITAEALAYFHNLYKEVGVTKFKTRITKYSEEFFTDFFETTYGDRWREKLGWEQVPTGELTTKGQPKMKWVIGENLLSFLPYYHGGWNEVSSVGPRGRTIYYDLKSAYPTAIIMAPDYDFGEMSVARDKDEIQQTLDTLMNNGPFQIAGILCAFRFKEGRQPLFSIQGGLGPLFPRVGYAHVMWPEYWVAVTRGMLEHIEVFSISTFKRLDTRNLGDKVFELLSKRKDPKLKLAYKNLLNFFYGKTSQGIVEIKDRISKLQPIDNAPASQLTCFPLSAYMTGFCRAVIGELCDLNPRYAITTDGFISPEVDLKKGELCDLVQEKLGDLGFTFVEVAFDGHKSLMIKTRGYVLVNEDGYSEDDESKTYVKTAKMGVQVFGDPSDPMSEATLFLKSLTAGEFTKTSWPGFAKLRGEIRPGDRESLAALRVLLQKHFESTDSDYSEDAIENDLRLERSVDKLKRDRRADVTGPVTLQQRINYTFDMKRIPLDVEDQEFALGDTSFVIPSFETEPLFVIEDFAWLRRGATRNMTAEDYHELLERFRRVR